ncbi:hypothetical protein ACVWZ6_001513 [Bradyrhizobium sp. GM6.1]
MRYPAPALSPRADEVDKPIPGDLGNEPPLVCGHAVVHHLVGQALHLFGGLADMTGIKGRMRIVFDDQLDGLGPLTARNLAGQPERQIDAGRHARRRDDFPRADDALIGPGLRTHDPQHAHLVPVRRRRLPF